MVTNNDTQGQTRPTRRSHLARWALASFLVTFTLARCLVFLMMSHRLPDMYLHVGGTHVHHLNYGIFLLSGLGAYLLFQPLQERVRTGAAIVYGVGLALTFDEFGMWLHLGGAYWQRASFDALAAIAALLGLLAVAPPWRRFRAVHWGTTVFLIMAVAVFGVLLVDSLRYVEGRIVPALGQLEQTAPG